MKINYDEIITKANERKEKLQELSVYCKDLPMQHERFLESITYFKALYLKASRLDIEGRNLISPNIEQHRESFASVINDITSLTVRGQGCRSDRFNCFLDAFK